MSRRLIAQNHNRTKRIVVGILLVVVAGCFIAAIEGVDALGIARALALITASIGVLYGVRLLLP